MNSSSPNHNPFLREIDPILCMQGEDLHQKLRSSPLSGIDTKSLGLHARYDLLDRMRLELFVPNSTALDATSRLYRMIRKGYLSRNPTTAEYRRRLMLLSRFAGREMQNLPWLPAFALGMREIGITGLGKTYEVRAALAQLPPYVEHGRSDAADWTHFFQVPYLYIGMSFDGSIGGLLLQILVALDNVIFTDYSQQKRLTSLSNEKLAVQVAIILANHAVGALVIDELQSSNFSDGIRGHLARMFFLRMLNFGIPLLLIGNPMGMCFLDSFSQDIRRLSSCGTIDLHPIEPDHPNFTEILAPAFWRYNVMPEPPDFEDKDGAILFKYCGGIRDFAVRVIESAQRIALELEEKRIGIKHLDMAFSGPDFSEDERTIIKAFCEKDALALMQFEDIPWETYFKKWNPDEDAGEAPAVPTTESKKPSGPAAIGPTAAKKTAKTLIAKRTKKKNQQDNIDAIKRNLQTDDLRGEGIQKHLVSSLADAIAEQHKQR